MPNAGIRSDSAGFGAFTYGGEDKFRFGADNSGQLAGFRNILINGDMRINQRGVTIAAAANGAYGPDRWKKVDASNMTQIVEAGNFVPNATYTLSGTGVTTQQLTAPASGNWTLPNIPIVATKIQLELGSIATPFENRPIGLELALCQRYYAVLNSEYSGQCITTTRAAASINFPVTMRTAPTLQAATANGQILNASGNTLNVTAIGAGTTSTSGMYLTLDVASGIVAGNATTYITGINSVSAEL